MAGRVGVVGLATMGGNLSRNLAARGYPVAVHDHAPGRGAEFVTQYASEGEFVDCDTLEALVAALDPLRIIILMTPAAAVDPIVDSLAPRLERGDAIVDAGNSHFRDTERRGEALKGKGIRFVGAGVSGGERGALTGLSVMAGGSPEDWEAVRGVLEAVSASVDGEPCCARVGPGGAGHYIKIVHNGIEYAVLQLIAEAYDLLRAGLRATPGEIGAMVEAWNDPKTGSYLLGITAEVLGHEDTRTGRPLVDVILDEAGHKGTGVWAVQSALDLGVPSTGVAEAALARVLSAGRARREAVRQALGPTPSAAIQDPSGFDEDVRQALDAATLVAYSQGLDQIRVASDEYQWGVELPEVVRIWQGGSILQSGQLSLVAEACADVGLASLLAAPACADRVKGGEAAWRRVVSWAALSAVPNPAFASLLAYVDGLQAERLPAALIQAQRDYFGAHTYRRVDADGAFHTDWSGEQTEAEA